MSRASVCPPETLGMFSGWVHKTELCLIFVGFFFSPFFFSGVFIPVMEKAQKAAESAWLRFHRL